MCVCVCVCVCVCLCVFVCTYRTYHDILCLTVKYGHVMMYVSQCSVCSMRSIRGGFILRNRGPSPKVPHGQCLTSMTKHDSGGSPPGDAGSRYTHARMHTCMHEYMKKVGDPTLLHPIASQQ
jgi:hypothetical protein